MKKLILFFTISAFVMIWGCDSPGSGCGRVEEDEIIVTGPVTGGNGIPQSGTILDLPTRGYVEEEYFFESQAAVYEMQGEATKDGKWTTAKSTDKKPFKTRLLIRRPTDAGKFSGTVIVEWLNVSAGADGAPGWLFNMPEILREGHVWVGVSAQPVGVQGGLVSLMPGALPLTTFDPERYGSLSHPGDIYGFDIFTIAAKVIRGEGSADILGGLKPQRLIAYGESQSAVMMLIYANGVQPVTKAFDGIFIHSRFSIGMPPDGPTHGCDEMKNYGAVLLRTDTKVPVFQFETEGDLSNFYLVRQPDTGMIRTWEVAGTSHADAYFLDYFKLAELEERLPEGMFTCPNANQGPHYIVVRAALHAMNLWVKDGTLPPQGGQLAMEGAKVLKDEHGNAMGGIRTPSVDVPISTLTTMAEDVPEPAEGRGCDDPATMMCHGFGHTEPFSPEKLDALYGTSANYVALFKKSAEQAAEAGFILQPELEKIIAEAQDVVIP